MEVTLIQLNGVLKVTKKISDILAIICGLLLLFGGMGTLQFVATTLMDKKLWGGILIIIGSGMLGSVILCKLFEEPISKENTKDCV